MIPGWYDDPWASGALRWWDGAQWTAHTHYPGNMPTVGLGPPGARELDRAARWGRRASIGLVVGAGVTMAQYLIWATVLHTVVHSLVHQLRVFNNQVNADPNSTPQLHLHTGNFFLLDLVSVPGLIVEVVFIAWLFQSAELGARLRLPAARAPMWAILGFLVPIVNLWFPYQVARDLLPPGDPNRRLAMQWWLCFLAQGVLSIPILIVSFFSLTAALVLALLSCAVTVLWAVRGRQLIAAVSVRHHELAGLGPAPSS